MHPKSKKYTSFWLKKSKVAENLKSCRKSLKLPKSCRATCAKPYPRQLGQVTYSTKWRAPETIWVISPRVGEPKCLYEKKLSRLTGLPYLPRQLAHPSCLAPPPPPPPPRDEFAFPCKQLVEFFKEISEKLARPGKLGGRVVSGTRDHINRAWVHVSGLPKGRGYSGYQRAAHSLKMTTT